MVPLIPPRTDFSILSMTEDWLVVGKPAPLIVHPTNDRIEVTLLGELKARGPGGDFYFVNRLDRETSGCVLVARSRKAAREFGRMMMRRQIRKHYRAIVHGWPEWSEIDVEQPMIRKGEVQESAIWVRQCVHPEGKPSFTRFWVEERFEREGDRYAIIGAEPRTGRTHQLRVHLEYLGHVIVGDKIYGGNGAEYLEFLESGWSRSLAKRLKLSRHALHGSGMIFEWEGEEFEVKSPWPDELAKFCLGSSEEGV